MRPLAFLPAIAAALCLSCTGTTGYQLVTFYAVAHGPPGVAPGITFTSDQGFTVTLSKAVMHIGALYLDQSLPSSGNAGTRCTLPGTYVGEIRAGRDVDLLSPDDQLFPITGDGSTIPAAAGQVWLSGPDVNDASDATVVLSIAGTATRGAASYPFSGDITIDRNRFPAAVGGALPGENPICVPRIVSPILTDITLSQSGTLDLQVDPVALFTNVDFSTLAQFKGDSGTTYGFTNDDSNQPSRNLYANLHAAGSVYRFDWRQP